MKLWEKIVLTFLVIVYIYIRIGPIINHTVPYTYDQGRDFLKVMEMVDNKRPTFIGPTTGIMGVFHGAWWYYLLLPVYMVTRGLPIGFYYAMLAFSLAMNLGFFFFLRKKIDPKAALLFLSIISISPYFVSIGFTVSNNIIVPYLMLSLIAIIFMLFEKKQNKLLYLALGLTLGFMFEFEVAFGLFIIPVFFVSSLLFKKIREQIYSLKTLTFTAAGLFLPLVPRLLFEVKNRFLQTMTLIEFINKPKLHNPQTFNKILYHRSVMLVDYAKGLFLDYSLWITLAVFIFTLIALWLYRKENRFHLQTKFLVTVTLLLLGFSFFYKDNFWFNYFESFHYIYLTLVVLGAGVFSRKYPKIAYLVIGFFVLLNAFVLSKDILARREKKTIGLSEPEATFEYIYSKTGKNDFCLRIYTPPVIPHTYVYLMNYKAKTQGYKISTFNFRDNKCYLIVESDPYSFRIPKWREENVPKNAKMIEKKSITDNVTVETWVSK